MRALIGFDQDTTGGDTGVKCADVVISPDSGDIPITVSLDTVQTEGHIFYRVVTGADPVVPAHNGDNAVSPTIRIGSNHGTVTLNSGIRGSQKTISALCYQAGLLDSNVSIGTYDVPESGL